VHWREKGRAKAQTTLLLICVWGSACWWACTELI